MGTPDFAVPTLQALIDSPHEVTAVYSQPPRPSGRGHKQTPSPVHALADAHNIPVYTPAGLKDEATQAQFRAHGAEAAIVAAYGLILPPAILAACPRGCLNVHPSDLPRWRGAAPIQRTIMAGDSHSALCIMQMDEGLDTGPVLLRQPVRVPAEMTAGELHDKMAALGAECVLKVLALADRLEPEPQAGQGVTYAPKITKAEARIDWSQPAHTIYHQIRGLNPYPAAVTQINGETVKIYKAEMVASPPPGPFPMGETATAGTVLDDCLTIACGEGTALRLLELQRPGKARMEAAAFLRGFTVETGTKIGY